MRPLTRDEVRAALCFEHPPRPPRAWTLWHNAKTLEVLGEPFHDLLAASPDDTINVGMGIDYWEAPQDDPTYRFAFGNKAKPKGLESFECPVIADWSELRAFLAEFPDANRPDATDAVRAAKEANPDRYVLVSWGHFFHQRLAYLRGIQPLMYDFYDAPKELRTVMDRLMDMYGVWARRAAKAGADGVWGGDDLGTQRGPFMEPRLFRELYAPHYAALADALHSNGLDFWLHTCGDVTELLDDLVAAGVDALHPIQAGTMDDESVAARYGGQITFWVGMDVQQVLPFGRPQEVRVHVRDRIRTFFSEDGGLILAAGNAILPDTPLGNLQAYL